MGPVQRVLDMGYRSLVISSAANDWFLNAETKALRRVNMKDAPPRYQSIVAYRRLDSGKAEGIVAAFLALLAAS